jgi:hypothetical protein
MLRCQVNCVREYLKQLDNYPLMSVNECAAAAKDDAACAEHLMNAFDVEHSYPDTTHIFFAFNSTYQNKALRQMEEKLGPRLFLVVSTNQGDDSSFNTKSHIQIALTMYCGGYIGRALSKRALGPNNKIHKERKDC